MKITGPYEGQHGAGEGANEAHENTEMRYEYSHENGEDDYTDPPRQTPNFKFSIDCPDRREDSFGSTSEKCSFE